MGWGSWPHNIAHETTIDSSIDQDLLNLYKGGVMKEDSTWYVEQGALNRGVQREMEA